MKQHISIANRTSQVAQLQKPKIDAVLSILRVHRVATLRMQRIATAAKKTVLLLPYTTVVYYTPLEFFSKLDCSTTKRVPIPNDTSPQSSRWDVSSAELCGTRPTAILKKNRRSPLQKKKKVLPTTTNVHKLPTVTTVLLREFLAAPVLSSLATSSSQPSQNCVQGQHEPVWGGGTIFTCLLHFSSYMVRY